jgi:hypothetical protein
MPEEIARSKSDKKKESWLALEEAKWSEQVIGGKVVKQEDITFEGFIPKWEKGYAMQNVGEYTQNVNLYNLNKYVVPEFGHLKISKITTLQLVTFFGELRRENGKEFATNSKLNIYKAVKSVFDAAHEWELIAKNPMDGVQRPRTSKKEKKAMRALKRHSISQSQKPSCWLYMTFQIGGDSITLDRSLVASEEANTWPSNGQMWTMIGMPSGSISRSHLIRRVKKSKVKSKQKNLKAGLPWYMAQLKEYERVWKKEKFQCKDWAGETNHMYSIAVRVSCTSPQRPPVPGGSFCRRRGFHMSNYMDFAIRQLCCSEKAELTLKPYKND